MSQLTQKKRQIQKTIQRKGLPVVWRKKSAVPDSEKPWRQGNMLVQDQNVSMIFVNPGESIGSLFEQLRGTDVGTSGLRGLMAAVNFPIDGSDVVMYQGQTFEITKISQIPPIGDALLYKIDFRA